MFGRGAWNKGVPAAPHVVAAMRAGFDSPDTRKKMSDAKRGKCGSDANNWQGGVDSIGPYSAGRRTVDGKREYAHRIVAEKILKRKLTTREHVHHCDRNRKNNSPLNLLVLDTTVHKALHSAFVDGYMTRDEQVAWLTVNGYQFEELHED